MRPRLLSLMMRSGVRWPDAATYLQVGMSSAQPGKPNANSLGRLPVPVSPAFRARLGQWTDDKPDHVRPDPAPAIPLLAFP